MFNILSEKRLLSFFLAFLLLCSVPVCALGEDADALLLEGRRYFQGDGVEQDLQQMRVLSKLCWKLLLFINMGLVS